MTSKFDKLVVALDGDAREEAEELTKWLAARGKMVYLVDMPKEHDPDSVPNFAELVSQAKPLDFYAAAAFRLSP